VLARILPIHEELDAPRASPHRAAAPDAALHGVRERALT